MMIFSFCARSTTIGSETTNRWRPPYSGGGNRNERRLWLNSNLLQNLSIQNNPPMSNFTCNKKSKILLPSTYRKSRWSKKVTTRLQKMSFCSSKPNSRYLEHRGKLQFLRRLIRKSLIQKRNHRMRKSNFNQQKSLSLLVQTSAVLHRTLIFSQEWMPIRALMIGALLLRVL